VEVGLLKYLREEIKFSSLDDLSHQIRLDAQAARAFPLTQKYFLFFSTIDKSHRLYAIISV
jgi:hypothetical protein